MSKRNGEDMSTGDFITGTGYAIGALLVGAIIGYAIAEIFIT